MADGQLVLVLINIVLGDREQDLVVRERVFPVRGLIDVQRWQTTRPFGDGAIGIARALCANGGEFLAKLGRFFGRHLGQQGLGGQA